MLLLAVTACSSDEAEPLSAETEGGLAENAAPIALEPSAVIGNGRAVTAASATGSPTLIATTIGVTLSAGEGSETPIPSGAGVPASRVAMASDGRHVLVEGQQASELWSIDGAPTLVSTFPAPASGAFSADGALVVTSTPLAVDITSTDGATQTAIDAPAGTQLGTAAMTDDGGLVAVPVSGDGADVITYSAAGGATAADVFAEPERKIVRLDVGSRPDLLVMQVSAADPFEAQLAAWNPATGTMLWETAAGVFPSSVVWDVGADSRVLATDGTTVRLLDVDGAVVNEWQFDEPRAATGIVATASGYAIVVNDGTVLLTGTDGNAGGVSVSIGRPIVDLRPLSGADGVTTVDASGAVSSWAADGSPISQIVVYQASAVNDVALSK